MLLKLQKIQLFDDERATKEVVYYNRAHLIRYGTNKVTLLGLKEDHLQLGPNSFTKMKLFLMEAWTWENTYEAQQDTILPNCLRKICKFTRLTSRVLIIPFSGWKQRIGLQWVCLFTFETLFTVDQQPNQVTWDGHHANKEDEDSNDSFSEYTVLQPWAARNIYKPINNSTILFL